MTCLYKLASAGAIALALGGCATLSPDGGFKAVAQAGQARTGLQPRMPRNDADARALDTLIAARLQQPLSVDDAAEIGLLNNRGLQATYWSLGVAEADLVQAGRLRNPALGFKRTHDGGDVAIERTLTFNLLGVLTAPLAGRIEARRFEQTRLLVADAAVKVVADTRRAWYEAVAAFESASYARQVEASAQAGAQLAERMRRAGNWNQLDMAREQAWHAQAVADAARAGQAFVAAREKLARLMGLSGDQASAYQLPERLPELPASDGLDEPAKPGLPNQPNQPAQPTDTAQALRNIEQSALRDRLDIQAATLETRQTAAALGLTRGTRWINVLDLGAVKNSAAGRSAPGYELTLEIPLFDWGDARLARAEASYMQSVNRLAEIAVQARGEGRESYLAYRASYNLARHYRDQVLPLRRQIGDQTLLRYNGMLASVFELLADAREQATSVGGYIGALKEFWLARVSLEAALGGRLPALPQAAAAAPDAPAAMPAMPAMPDMPAMPGMPATPSTPSDSGHHHDHTMHQGAQP